MSYSNENVSQSKIAYDSFSNLTDEERKLYESNEKNHDNSEISYLKEQILIEKLNAKKIQQEEDKEVIKYFRSNKIFNNNEKFPSHELVAIKKDKKLIDIPTVIKRKRRKVTEDEEHSENRNHNSYDNKTTVNNSNDLINSADNRINIENEITSSSIKQLVEYSSSDDDNN